MTFEPTNLIDKDKVADVKAKLEKGQIDIKEPHSPEVQAAMGEGKQLKEHFQKIANIKKG